MLLPGTSILPFSQPKTSSDFIASSDPPNLPSTPTAEVATSTTEGKSKVWKFLKKLLMELGGLYASFVLMFLCFSKK